MKPHPLNVVIAFVRPAQLNTVKASLFSLPEFPGMSVNDVRGCGVTAADPRESSRDMPLETCVRLEIFCRGNDTSSIIHTIQAAAHTGHHGDGKILVLDVAWAVRIRTNEIGDAALIGKRG